MASAASIFPEIAGFNPTATLQQGQLRQQQLGLNAIQAQRQQAEIPLIQQQTQQAGLQNQLVQQQINDQKAIGAAWAQWDPDQDPSGQGLLRTAVRNGATPQSVMAVQQHLAAYNASLATADKTRLENQKMRDDDYAGKMQAIIDADPAQQEQLWQTHLADFAKDAPGEQIPPHFTAQDAKTFLNLHQFRSQQIENELKQREAAEAGAKTAADVQQTQLAADQYNREQAARANPNDPNAQAAALTAEQRSTQALKQAELQKQTETLQESIAQHHAENTLRQKQINIEQDKDRRDQAIYDQIYGPGANEALIGVEPKLRLPATQAAQKAADDYNKSVAASRDISTLISEARSGNKAAYANIPIEGVLQITTSRGTTRINRNELEAYAGAGSIFDRIEGKIGKWTAGASIPPDILKDLQDMHNSFESNAAKAYDSRLSSVNQNYHSHFKSVAPAANAPAATAPAQQIRRYNPSTGKLE